MDWSQKTVLVAGGTSRVGRVVAERVAEGGGTVGFTYQSSKRQARRLREELPGDGHHCWECEVTDSDEVDRTVAEAFETFDGVDAVVYTIGFIAFESVGESAVDTWRALVEVNATGAFNVVEAVAPRFRSSGGGSLVAVSASQGILREGGLAGYDASKRALEAYIKETARELGPAGVRANVVAPGYIRDPDELSEAHRTELLATQAIQRVTTAADVADACLFLCSDRAEAITGTVLPVDGGSAVTGGVGTHGSMSDG